MDKSIANSAAADLLVVHPKLVRYQLVHPKLVRYQLVHPDRLLVQFSLAAPMLPQVVGTTASISGDLRFGLIPVIPLQGNFMASFRSRKQLLQ
jgi:hypothetical protein